MKKDFEFDLKQAKDINLFTAFHVRINKHYVATVHALTDFIWGINNCDPDETFGEITKFGNKEEKGHIDFLYSLTEVIAKFKGFASFNSCYKHTFVQCEDKNETISIKTKEGKRITVSIMEGAQCVDIVYHDSPLETIDNGSKEVIPQFEVLGFNLGTTPIKRTPVTIVSIMLT